MVRRNLAQKGVAMTANELPDLDKVRDAIKAAHQAEDHLLALDRNAVVRDDGHPIIAPNDDDRESRSRVRHHGRRPAGG